MTDWKMSKWQRGILIGMYIVACRAMQPTDVWFTRRALEFIMWFDWRQYYTDKIGELIDRDWIVQSTNHSGIIVYRLTQAAHVQIAGDLSNAMRNVNYDPPSDEMFSEWKMK